MFVITRPVIDCPSVGLTVSTGAADRLILRPYFHFEINAQRLIDQQLLLIAGHHTKPGMLCRHLVTADGQRQQLKGSIVVGGCCALVLRGGVGHGDLRLRDDCTLRVEDRSIDPSSRILSRSRGEQPQHHRYHNDPVEFHCGSP
jgi:hypothetical protein